MYSKLFLYNPLYDNHSCNILTWQTPKKIIDYIEQERTMNAIIQNPPYSQVNQ